MFRPVYIKDTGVMSCFSGNLGGLVTWGEVGQACLDFTIKYFHMVVHHYV